MYSIFFEQLSIYKKGCIFVSSSNLQNEHSGEVTFPNLKNSLLAYRISCKTLYWNMRVFVSKVALRIRIFFPVKLGCFIKTRFTSKVVKTTNLRFSCNVVVKNSYFFVFPLLFKTMSSLVFGKSSIICNQYIL